MGKMNEKNKFNIRKEYNRKEKKKKENKSGKVPYVFLMHARHACK